MKNFVENQRSFSFVKIFVLCYFPRKFTCRYSIKILVWQNRDFRKIISLFNVLLCNDLFILGTNYI